MKRIFTLILFSMIAFNAIHAEITWKVTDGTLIISGTEMEDYYVIKPAPWKEREFRSVIIENGVTNIGSYAFFAVQVLLQSLFLIL